MAQKWIAKGYCNDGDNKKPIDELNLSDGIAVETISKPGAMVKTVVIKRVPILKQKKTTEDILDEAAQKVADMPSEIDPKDDTVKCEIFLEMLNANSPDGQPANIFLFQDDDEDGIYSDIEKPLSMSSIYAYDIFEDIQERLDEAKANRKEQSVEPEPPKQSDDQKKPIDKEPPTVSPSTQKLQRILELTHIHPILRFMAFFPFGFALFNKQW
jgi:hypothetical protein